MSDIYNKAYSNKGYKRKGGKCCGTCKHSKSLFGGLFLCVKDNSNAIVALLDVCDAYEKYKGDVK